jgi:hypothetical protein
MIYSAMNDPFTFFYPRLVVCGCNVSVAASVALFSSLWTRQARSSHETWNPTSRSQR